MAGVWYSRHQGFRTMAAVAERSPEPSAEGASEAANASATMASENESAGQAAASTDAPPVETAPNNKTIMG